MNFSALAMILMAYNPFAVNQQCDNPAVIINKKFQDAHLYCMDTMKLEKAYPVSTGIIKGKKEELHDGKTPEGFFYIRDIVDTSSWKVNEGMFMEILGLGWVMALLKMRRKM